MKNREIRMLDENERKIAQVIEKAGYSHSASLILVALALNGPTSLKLIGEITGQKDSTISISVKKLEAKRLVNTLEQKTRAGNFYYKTVELTDDLSDLLSQHIEIKQADVFLALERAKAECQKYTGA